MCKLHKKTDFLDIALSYLLFYDSDRSARGSTVLTTKRIRANVLCDEQDNVEFSFFSEDSQLASAIDPTPLCELILLIIKKGDKPYTLFFPVREETRFSVFSHYD